MTSQYYRDHLLDKLHNLHLGHMSVQDYIATFEDLTCHSDMSEHHFETITRLV